MNTPKFYTLKSRGDREKSFLNLSKFNKTQTTITYLFPRYNSELRFLSKDLTLIPPVLFALQRREGF